MSTSNEKAITDNAIIYENNSFHNSAFFNSSVYKKKLKYLPISLKKLLEEITEEKMRKIKITLLMYHQNLQKFWKVKIVRLMIQ